MLLFSLTKTFVEQCTIQVDLSKYINIMMMKDITISFVSQNIQELIFVI